MSIYVPLEYGFLVNGPYNSFLGCNASGSGIFQYDDNGQSPHDPKFDEYLYALSYPPDKIGQPNYTLFSTKNKLGDANSFTDSVRTWLFPLMSYRNLTSGYSFWEDFYNGGVFHCDYIRHCDLPQPVGDKEYYLLDPDPETSGGPFVVDDDVDIDDIFQLYKQTVYDIIMKEVDEDVRVPEASGHYPGTVCDNGVVVGPWTFNKELDRGFHTVGFCPGYTIRTTISMEFGCFKWSDGYEVDLPSEYCTIPVYRTCWSYVKLDYGSLPLPPVNPTSIKPVDPTDIGLQIITGPDYSTLLARNNCISFEIPEIPAGMLIHFRVTATKTGIIISQKDTINNTSNFALENISFPSSGVNSSNAGQKVYVLLDCGVDKDVDIRVDVGVNS